MLRTDGTFEFAWDEKGGDFLRQDVEIASGKRLADGTFQERKIEVSLHTIAKARPPCYHAAVDIIDAFCFSWYKNLSDEELEKVYQDFMITHEKKIKQREEEQASKIKQRKEEEKRNIKITSEVKNKLKTECYWNDEEKYKEALEHWQALKPLTHDTIVSFVRRSGSKLSPEDNTKLDSTIEGVLKITMHFRSSYGEIYFKTYNK